MKNFKTYAFFILSALGVGGLSALLTAGSMEIYKEVTTPPLSPPSVLFPIVWTVLYVLMGVCAAWVYLSFAPEKQKRFKGEIDNFIRKWKPFLDDGDPYYNVNLTLQREDFTAKRQGEK